MYNPICWLPCSSWVLLTVVQSGGVSGGRKGKAFFPMWKAEAKSAAAECTYRAKLLSCLQRKSFQGRNAARRGRRDGWLWHSIWLRNEEKVRDLKDLFLIFWSISLSQDCWGSQYSIRTHWLLSLSLPVSQLGGVAAECWTPSHLFCSCSGPGSSKLWVQCNWWNPWTGSHRCRVPSGEKFERTSRKWLNEWRILDLASLKGRVHQKWEICHPEVMCKLVGTVDKLILRGKIITLYKVYSRIYIPWR